jgi:hypothetical protein
MQKLVEIMLPILLLANKRDSKFSVLMCIQLKCNHAKISRYCALNIIMSSRLNITLRNIQSTMVIVCFSSLCYPDANHPDATVKIQNQCQCKNFSYLFYSFAY